jgi:hypothetical protein
LGKFSARTEKRHIMTKEKTTTVVGIKATTEVLDLMEDAFVRQSPSAMAELERRFEQAAKEQEDSLPQKLADDCNWYRKLVG